MITTLLMGLLLVATGPGDQARQALDDGRYQLCLDEVARLDASYGRSVLGESMRAVALERLGRHLEAFRSVETYFQLATKSAVQSTDGHREMVSLRSRLLRALDEARTKLIKERQQKRDEAEKEARSLEEATVRQQAAAAAQRAAAALDREGQARRKQILINAAAARRQHSW